MAFETDFIFFLIKTTGVIAIAITPTPIIASFQEFISNTITSATSSKIDKINIFNVKIKVFDAVSGSVKNLFKIKPDEFIS